MNTPKPHPLRIKVEKLIVAKLSILQRWAKAKEVPWKRNELGIEDRDANGELQVDYVPLSIDAFSDWQSNDNCEFNRNTEEGLSLILSTSRSTLYQEYHNDARVSVDKVTRTLRETVKTQLLNYNKAARIEILISENRQLKALIDQQESEILLMRSKAMENEHNYNRTKRAGENGRKEMQRQLKELEQINASLVATVTKLVPIKKVAKE